MSEEERDRVVESLPSEFPVSESLPPEGDPHYNAKTQTRASLEYHQQQSGRLMYFACELPVYYPGEPMFAPDVIAVLDVERRERMSWVVSREGKGVDLAIEIFVAGDRRKDMERNVERYARLGIREYFIFDRGGLRLDGYRLDAARAAYSRLVPQEGRFSSEVLGLTLCIEGTRLRFYDGADPVPTGDELQTMADRMKARYEEAALKLAEEALLRQEAEDRLAQETLLRQEAEDKLAQEARQREELERKLAEALATDRSLPTRPAG